MNNSKPASEQRGLRILAGLGLLVLLCWFYFAWDFYQRWQSLADQLQQQPERMIVSDQGLLSLLLLPLLAVFSVLLAKLLNQAKTGSQKPGLAAWAVCAAALLMVVVLPLRVMANDMQWFVDTASPVAYRICSQTVQGKGKNTWQQFLYVRSDLLCP